MSSDFCKKSERTTCSPLRRGAANRGRTGTVLLPKDFKSFVSAYSTIAANPFVGLSHRYAVILPPFTGRVKQFAQGRISGIVSSKCGQGWMAVLFAVLSVLVYIGGPMCLHLSAFRIATNVCIRLTRHIATLPLGSIERFGSGKLCRIMAETSGAAAFVVPASLMLKPGIAPVALVGSVLLIRGSLQILTFFCFC